MSRLLRRGRWILAMALRENRRHRRRLLLFISSVAIGIAALVAINGFRINLDASVNDKAKTLLGADLLLSSDRPFGPAIESFADSLDASVAREVSLSSMAYFPAAERLRIARLRALEGDFPFYGAVRTAPEGAFARFQEGRNALVDEAMMIQFGASVGDSIRLGLSSFRIAGALRKFPGETGAGAAIAPAVIIPLRHLKETGLVAFGSLASYRLAFRLPDEIDADALARDRSAFLAEQGTRAETVGQRKRQIGRVTENLTAFLNLVGLASLLLGGIGVSSAITVYVRQKMASVAVLRCLGCTSPQVLAIYLVQTLLFGFAGTLAGVGLGVAVQFVTPSLVARILPVEVTVFLAWEAIAQGMAGGFVVAALFTLLPLVSIRHVSPLLTLRTSYEDVRYSRTDALTITIAAAIAMAVLAFVTLQLENLLHALVFVAALGLAIGVFALAARFLIWALRRSLPRRVGYTLRQGLANLHRPNNQTTILVMVLGMGTFLVTTLYLIQHALLSQVAFSGAGDRANMVLFDIQPDQRRAVRAALEEHTLPLLDEVAVVTMRLESINGTPVHELRVDSSGRYEEWALRAELRATYRAAPTASETVVRGAFRGTAGDTVYVSVADRYADALGLALGDRLAFDVQGRPLTATVGSVRQIAWQSFEPNFLTVFPTGILEDAPQFFVFLTRASGAAESARFQRALVQALPGVSIVDLALVLEAVESVLDEVSFVIRFMALFTIATGLVILVSALAISRLERVREAVLLRTMGAQTAMVRGIMTVEYAALGMLAGVLGVGLAWVTAWALVLLVFDVPFAPPPPGLAVLLVAVPLLTVAIGALGSRRLFERPPMEILRSEG